MSTIADRSKSAAWPALLGVQGLVILSLGWVGWTVGADTQPEVPEMDARLQAMDIPAATAAVAHAIEAARHDAAVTEGDVLRVTSFLALAARGADLDVVDIELTQLESSGGRGVAVVEAVLEVSGHIFDLPIFLDGAHRQRSVGRIQSLAFDVKPGGEMHGTIRLHYHRPRPMDTAWIADELATAAPGADAAAPVLADAAVLAAWRAFGRSQPARSERAHLARSRAAHELPANLIEIQASGGRFVWDADEGIVIR